MEVFQTVYNYLKDQLVGNTIERDALLIASEAYLVFTELRPGAIVVLNPPNNDLYSDLRKLLKPYNLVLLQYQSQSTVYMILPEKTSALLEYEHLQHTTNRNAVDIQTGRMLGYAAPHPLRTIQTIGKQAGEVRIRVGSVVGQIAPQVVPADIDIRYFLHPIADALNALYSAVGLEYRAEVVIRPFPLRAGTRRMRKKRSRSRKRY